MWPLSDDRFRDLLDQVPAVFYAESHEPEPRTLSLSANAAQILGSGAEEHLHDQDLWWRSIHPDDIDTLMTAWTEAYRTLEPYHVDYRYIRPDGGICGSVSMPRRSEMPTARSCIGRECSSTSRRSR